MKKFILIIFIMVALGAQADMVLQGEVKYNVETARDELTSVTVPSPNIQQIRDNYFDKNFKENAIYLLKGKAKLKDRELAFFSDNSYGVIYDKNKKEVFYYFSDGRLMFIELRDGLNYPFRSYKYDLQGNLVNMGLRVSKEETFIYTPDGELIAHWIKNTGYDTKGNIIMIRRYAE